MALIFMDGFDHYNVADVGKKWGSVGAGAATATMDTGRTGTGQSLKQVCSGSNIKDLNKPFSQVTDAGVGFAIKVSAYPTGSVSQFGLVAMTSPESGYVISHMYLSLNSDGSLSICTVSASNHTTRATGGTIPLNTWTYVEWKTHMHTSTGTSYVSLNGVPAFSYSGTTVASYVSNIGFFYTQDNYSGYRKIMMSITGTVWLDDVYIFDNNTGITDFLGDVTVNVKYPTANGTTNNGTPSSGSNYQCVDETLADTADYVTHDAVDEIDTFPVTTLPTGTTVLAAQVVALTKRTTVGGAQMKACLRQSGANYLSSGTTAPSTDYSFQRFIYEHDALGNDWTYSNFNGMEFGIKKTT